MRHGDVFGSSVLPGDKSTKDKVKIDEKYVSIQTSHFSPIIVTAEGTNCCSKSADLLLFGSLANNPEMGPSVRLKVYLSSIHCQIKDFKKVSPIYYVRNR